jgi:hypothetical protein
MNSWDLEYAAKQKESFFVDQTNAETGPVIRWKSNNAIPFDDMLEAFVSFGWITEQERTNSAEQKDVETAAFIEDYRKNQTPPDAEQLFEMRAAFGEGATIVDVFSGRKIKL